MTSTTAPRARLATRFVALLIDLVIVSGLVTLAGLALTVATDGRLRISSAVVSVNDCESAAVPDGFALPQGFAAGEVRRCTSSLFGFVYDRRLVVEAKAAQDSDAGEGGRVVVTLDKAGRPVEPFYLDVLILPALVLYLLLLEWRRGTTPGKWLVGAEVVSLAGQDGAGGLPSLMQSAQRTLVRALVLVPGSALQMTAPSETGRKISVRLITSSGAPESIVGDVLGWVAFVYIVAMIVQAVRGRRSPHDLWANTDVVCPGSPR